MSNDYLGSESARLQAILTGVQVGTWEWNKQTGETRFNERWADMFGYTLAELEPISIQTWINLVHPDDLKRSDEALQQHFQGNTQFYELEVRVRHKQGHWVWIRDSGKVATYTESGEPEWICGAHIDITEAKRIEEDLRQAQKRQRFILESLPSIVYSQTSREPWTNVFVSANVQKILGYTVEDWQSPNNELFWQRMHPDDVDRVRRAVKHWQEQGYPNTLLQRYRFRHADGHLVVLDDLLRAVRAESGELIEFIGSLTDVTAQHEAEQRLTKIADNVHGVLYQFQMDTEGTMSFPYASAGIELVYGVKPEQVVADGSVVFAVIHPDDFERVLTAVEQSRDTLQPWECEYRVVLDGEESWVYGHSIPERLDDGSTLWHGLIIDVTDRKRLEIDLERSQVQLEAAQRIANLGYWEANLETGELMWSATVYEIFGLDPHTVSPCVKAFRELVHPDDLALLDKSQERAKKTGIHDIDHRIIRPDGQVRWVREWAYSKTSTDGHQLLGGTVQDITERKELEILLREQSIRDSLTGLFNRRYFTDMIESRFRQRRRDDNSVCSIITFDFDHFKQVNDQYGHMTGDEVLKRAGKVVKASIRESDIPARTGGEEFAIMLPNTSLKDSERLAERLRQAMEEELFMTTEGELRVTVTCGVTQFHPQDETYQDVLGRADRALYQGKQAGRNCVVRID